LILEKIPLLALAAGACVMTVLAEEESIATLTTFSMPVRLGNAVVSYAVYLRQMVWPEGLAVFYPYALNGLRPWEVALAGMLLAGLSVAAWAERRRRPWLLMGWLWYLGMLTPMIGIVQVGAFAHADRHTYLPQIGIYVGLTWLAAEWSAKWQACRVAFGGLMTGVILALMVCAWKQTAYWKNSETLWNHTLACTTDNDMAHINLGTALFKEGRVDETILHFQAALQIKPDDADAHYRLGAALLQKGSVDEAITHFQAALQIHPDDADAHYNLATALRQEGRVDEAIAHYQAALRIKPDNADAHYNLAVALRQEGRVDEAIAHYQAALQIQPDNADAHNNLGTALLQKGRVDEAIAHLQKALQINPGHGTARNNLGNALLQKGNAAEAIAHFQQALQIEPANPAFQNNLAWLLATCSEASLRNGNKAVELAERANQLAGGKDPLMLHTLAAAFAEAGRFSEAVETAQRALRLAGAQSNTGLAGALQSEMKLYQAGKPFHSPERTH
jgi:tetratricopeptide (TPR) repeat protein